MDTGKKEVMALGIPGDVWKSSIIAFGVGVLILLIPHGVEYSECLKAFLGEGLHWKEIVRDIGIAFLVAGIVSFMYEWSTRVTAEHHKMTSVVQTVMSSFVPEDVWNEVNSEILHRMVARRNLDIQLTLYRSGKLPTGEPITLPSTQAVLSTKVSYELYGLVTGSYRSDVTHYLEWEMRNEDIDLPRFIRVSVTPAESGTSIEYIDDKLDEIYDKKAGCIRLADKHSIKLLPITENKPAKIIIERYELINTPGLYTMVMPEMVIPPPNQPGESETRPTISIAVLEGSQTEGLRIDVYTWFSSPKREFKRASASEWRFNGVMLPGQGFSVVFSRAEVKDLLPQSGVGH